MRYVLPRLLPRIAGSQELLLLFAVAWGTGFASAGEALGFSKEIGAFLAGFSLASNPYREAVSSRLAPLRDFLLLFFFIDLGAKLDLSAIGDQLPAAVVLSLFVLIGNPLIVMAIMGWMGYRKRTGFLAGLTVAQISEFSIIFVGMGIALGHVTDAALNLVTVVGLVTIGMSTYMILYSHLLYERLRPWLGWFERQHPDREAAIEAHPPDLLDPQVVLFGVGRYGRRLCRRLAEGGVRVLAVDFDPQVIDQARMAPFPVRFGDVEDSEFLAGLPLGQAALVVSTLADPEINVGLHKALRAQGWGMPMAAVAHTERDAARLRQAGLERILMPFWEAADVMAAHMREELERRDVDPAQGRQPAGATPRPGDGLGQAG